MTWQISRKFDDLLWNDPRLINNKHLLSIGATVADTFCLRKCDCVLFTSPSFMEDNFLPNSKMKKSKTCNNQQIWQGNSVEDGDKPGWIRLNLDSTWGHISRYWGISMQKKCIGGNAYKAYISIKILFADPFHDSLLNFCHLIERTSLNNFIGGYF